MEGQYYFVFVIPNLFCRTFTYWLKWNKNYTKIKIKMMAKNDSYPYATPISWKTAWRCPVSFCMIGIRIWLYFLLKFFDLILSHDCVTSLSRPKLICRCWCMYMSGSNSCLISDGNVQAKATLGKFVYLVSKHINLEIMLYIRWKDIC